MVVIPPPSPTSPTTKTRTISDLHRGSESEALLSPPPYATREAATSPPEAVKPPREPASRRFLSALYAAVVIYFVLSLVWAAIVGLIKYKAEVCVVFSGFVVPPQLIHSDSYRSEHILQYQDRTRERETTPPSFRVNLTGSLNL